MVNLVTSEMKNEVVLPLAQRLTALFPKVKTVVNNITAKKASIAVGEREAILAGDGILQDRIGASLFQISANSFFQTNSLGPKSSMARSPSLQSSPEGKPFSIFTAAQARSPSFLHAPQGS